MVYQRTKQYGCIRCYTVLIQGLACIMRFLKKESECLKIINPLKYTYNSGPILVCSINYKAWL